MIKLLYILLIARMVASCDEEKHGNSNLDQIDNQLIKEVEPIERVSPKKSELVNANDFLESIYMHGSLDSCSSRSEISKGVSTQISSKGDISVSFESFEVIAEPQAAMKSCIIEMKYQVPIGYKLVFGPKVGSTLNHEISIIDTEYAIVRYGFRLRSQDSDLTSASFRFLYEDFTDNKFEMTNLENIETGGDLMWYDSQTQRFTSYCSKGVMSGPIDPRMTVDTGDLRISMSVHLILRSSIPSSTSNIIVRNLPEFKLSIEECQ